MVYMIKRAYRAFALVIVTGLMAACCCVYTATAPMLIEASAADQERLPVVQFNGE
jgi:hypothetical protein